MYEAIWEIVFVLNSGFFRQVKRQLKKTNFMNKDIGKGKHLFTFDDVGKPVRTLNYKDQQILLIIGCPWQKFNPFLSQNPASNPSRISQ